MHALTEVGDENGLLQGYVRQGQVALGHLGLVRLAGELVLPLLQALEVRGDVRLPVARRAEDLLTVRAREGTHSCGGQVTAFERRGQKLLCF